jgi:hypothetical protein
MLIQVRSGQRSQSYKGLRATLRLEARSFATRHSTDFVKGSQETLPGKAQMPIARKIKTEGRNKQSFETLRMTDPGVERWADKPDSLTAFCRWQDPSREG